MVLLGFTFDTGRKTGRAPKVRLVLFGLYFAIVLFKTPVPKPCTVRVTCPARKGRPHHWHHWHHCGHRLDWKHLSFYWGREHG
ncbi:hypothetical protein PQD73_gp014 [Stenotrophomonas phage Salva]|uniref:Uncharacterized protein n=1 Tax=Stenotrophomonas phage Salva TaxID=2801524 RepID=A0A7U3WJU5_9CAUD|nr:hypothetical protein PQD73_gp014 [Stenotrophomonas phage Salva]QQM18178.1 hypothetical protein CPT_Salva_014 [Stenotrophomonas phage Salva]